MQDEQLQITAEMEFDHDQPLNVTRVVDYDGASRYLVVARLEGETDHRKLSNQTLAELAERLQTRLEKCFAPAPVTVILIDQSIDLEFFQLKGADDDH